MTNREEVMTGPFEFGTVLTTTSLWDQPCYKHDLVVSLSKSNTRWWRTTTTGKKTTRTMTSKVESLIHHDDPALSLSSRQHNEIHNYRPQEFKEETNIHLQIRRPSPTSSSASISSSRPHPSQHRPRTTTTRAKVPSCSLKQRSSSVILPTSRDHNDRSSFESNKTTFQHHKFSDHDQQHIRKENGWHHDYYKAMQYHRDLLTDDLSMFSRQLARFQQSKTNKQKSILPKGLRPGSG